VISCPLPAGYPDTAVAIGKFEAIHLGHQQLIHELVAAAEDGMLAAGVIAFDRHPNAILDPANVPLPVIGPEQKHALLEQLGLDFFQELVFDSELASLSPQEFVTRHLLPLRPRLVLVGEGFRFGAKGAGNIEVLRAEGKKHGFVAKQVATVMIGDTKVSASKIRSLLDAGKVAEANLLLGRNHATEGIVEHGRKLGRELGFPTANIARDAEGYLPGDGVYAGYLICDGVRYPAAHSVGTNDSIAAVPRLLESHVIGRDDLDLYDKQVRCEYVEQVRGWAKFSSVDELTQQIARDVADASAILEL
jgi:riboflavin kinase/FMN adenylyltransferase